MAQYRQHLEQQERLAQERAALLQRQKRMAQYRFQEEYLERVRQQQIYLRDHRFDYDHDPYFYYGADLSLQPWRQVLRNQRIWREDATAGGETMAMRKASAPARQTATTVGAVATTKTLMPIGTQTTVIVAIT